MADFFGTVKMMPSEDPTTQRFLVVKPALGSLISRSYLRKFSVDVLRLNKLQQDFGFFLEGTSRHGTLPPILLVRAWLVKNRGASIFPLLLVCSISNWFRVLVEKGRVTNG